MSLAQQLERRSLGDLFVWPAHDQTVERIWAGGANSDALDEVIASPESSQMARFIACEVFFAKDVFFMQRHSPAQVAQIYAEALAGNFTGRANSWGLLYQHEDEGPVGVRFLQIGRHAVPALTALLDDDSTPLQYHGSEEATVGNAYGFRVKDFAAYYLGRIRNERLKYFAATKKRDAQIDKLKKKLAKERGGP